MSQQDAELLFQFGDSAYRPTGMMKLEEGQTIQVCGTIVIHPGQNFVKISNGPEEGMVSIAWDPTSHAPTPALPPDWWFGFVMLMCSGFFFGFAISGTMMAIRRRLSQKASSEPHGKD